MLRAFGYQHLSIGTLRRLARRGELPSDVPVSLMLALRRIPSGELLPNALVEQCIKVACTSPLCVLDGLPATAAHIDLLPKDTLLVYLHTVQAVRISRLIARAEQTPRQWHPDSASNRDRELAVIAARLRAEQRLVFVRNNGDLVQLQAAAMSIAEQMRRKFMEGRNQLE
jgi:hypothetical protein